MPKITPFLWFDNQAEEAAKFYTSIFRNSKIGNISRYGDGAPMPKGTALVVPFELDGQAFSGLNGGPMFRFSEAVSFSVACQTQEEIDYYWSKLGEGGQEQQCGWLKDRFGLSWQIVPAMLQEWASDPQKMGRVMPLIMGMVKIDLPALEKVAQG